VRMTVLAIMLVNWHFSDEATMATETTSSPNATDETRSTSATVSSTTATIAETEATSTTAAVTEQTATTDGKSIILRGLFNEKLK